jgi:hypothetical protein
MNDYLFALLVIVVCFCAASISRYLVPYIKQLMTIKEVEAAVKSAEQTIKGSGMGVTKKAQVIADVTSWLNAHHISITEAQLSILIEAAVKSMNMGG